MSQELSLEKVVRALETADNTELPMNADYFDQLHDKIMARVETTKVEKVNPVALWMLKPKRYIKHSWKAWLSSSLALVTASLLGLHFSTTIGQWIPKSHTFKVAKNEKELILGALRAPDTFSSSVIVYQTSEDYLGDVASESFEISQEKFDLLMSEIN